MLAKKKKARNNERQEYLKRIGGIDLCSILVTGINMEKWESPKHFASWLSLS
ncbi:MAG: hypothetical protein LBL90_00260 [Prevotellaceae bacterium]|jgi:hypothetical protein|nr:hypothetical protein [Prevotellaceae bacterium]